MAGKRAEPALTARGHVTRERILAAAASLIHRTGVAGTSLDDVGAATGTSRSQMYHYFSDKSALVHAVVVRQVELVLAAQRPELDAVDSITGLRRWADQVVASNEQLGSERGCPLGRLASELAETDSAARAELEAGFRRWQGLIVAGLHRMRRNGELEPEADYEMLAWGLLAAVQGGLLLAQTARNGAPLRAALDTAVQAVSACLREPELS